MTPTSGWSGPRALSKLDTVRLLSRLGLHVPALCAIEFREVVERGADGDLVRLQCLLKDSERPLHQRLGISVPVSGTVQQAKVVEHTGHTGMVGTQRLLVDGQRSPHERLGVGVPTLRTVGHCQIEKCCAHRRIDARSKHRLSLTASARVASSSASP